MNSENATFPRASAVPGFVDSVEVAAAAAALAAAEVAEELEWLRAEVVMTEVVRRTR